ncbi:hypothetical protein Q8A73_007039 [Channa argus]|nr:hypothetical protein Q8A73_007039 [Channa argus]
MEPAESSDHLSSCPNKLGAAASSGPVFSYSEMDADMSIGCVCALVIKVVLERSRAVGEEAEPLKSSGSQTGSSRLPPAPWLRHPWEQVWITPCKKCSSPRRCQAAEGLVQTCQLTVKLTPSTGQACFPLSSLEPRMG